MPRVMDGRYSFSRVKLKEYRETLGLWCRLADAARICGFEYQTVSYWQLKHGLLSHGGVVSDGGRQRYFNKRDLLRLTILRCLVENERERAGGMVRVANRILPLEPEKKKEAKWFVVRMADGKVWGVEEFEDVVERMMKEEAVGVMVVNVQAAKRKLEGVLEEMRVEGELTSGMLNPDIDPWD